MKKITIEIEVPEDFNDINLSNLIYDAEKLASGDWLASWWHISDVQERAEENGDTLSDDEARDVLAYMDKYHDCEVGINWYSMDVHIDNVIDEREEDEIEEIEE
jgi:hypothetical protein